EIVEEAHDGLDAVAKAERAVPDVALIDASLINCDGIRATALIRERVPDCRVILLTEDEDPATLVAAMEAGASGYLTKMAPLDHLAKSVRAVDRGETAIPRSMVGSLIWRLLKRRDDQDEALGLVSRLTLREREVLALLADGANNDVIAQELVISPQTARTHVHNVLQKLNVHSRLEAVAMVRRTGVLKDSRLAP
ncbi:MAG TPA: response regulator transcription factor, partial [Actinomycetota bacterium]